ncbi:hypothetical protein ABN250_17340 [Providencia stuartii]|uniref:hypothetical protein n=1 Tax=Providencia stuartii TaxID=588 RepID=UPI0032D9C837
MMKLSRSTFYTWQKRPVKLLDDDMLELHQRACSLFRESRQSLGYRMLAAQLRKEGYAISDYRTRLHTANNYLSPVEYENSFRKVS